MRYALLSDVHGNLPALDAVLADVDARGNVDAVYHLGDLVGYGPWPNEVVARLRDAEIPGVAGNYDSTVATRYKHCGCRSESAYQEELAHQSFEWTLRHTSEESKRFLRNLPFRIDIRPLGGHQAGPTVRLVHGSETLNTVYQSADRSDELLATMGSSMGARAGDVVCFGHTHKPWYRVVAGIHFVNAGSVGRPKDGDPRAGYVVLAVEGSEVAVTLARVAYDVEAAAHGILLSGLPRDFAAFLQSGGQPAAVDAGLQHHREGLA